MTQLISYEPATGAELWRGETGNVDAEVGAARAGWAGWATKPFEDRAETLRRFADIVRARADEFADIIARETGKPLWEAKGEVDAVIGKVGISITAYGERTPERRMDGALGAQTAIRHKPHGVLAVLGPYNFPAHLPNGHIVPALLAGNAVVFKPSEKTPASGAFLFERFREAGVPESAIRLVQGGREEGKAVAAHPGIDGLLFTGSAGAGAALNRQFADTPQRILALELGGNNPLVVWDTPDIHAAATIVVQSGFLSAGQRCTCGRRLIVRDGTEGPLLQEVGKILDRVIVGAPHDQPAPFMGPVIDNDAAAQVLAAYEALIAKGGVALRPMTRPDTGKPFLTPGIVDVTDVQDLPDEEIFGPLVQLIRVANFDAAIAAANATRYGLAASVVTDSADLYRRFWAGARAGVINWNRPTNGAPSNAPFGGVGISGNHRPSAFYAADYCAYPVTSVEAEEARATIGQGLLDA
ncbi:succinylglutamate-semialdehyde dehydrogenase [Sphingomonas crusticola]|uniref:succinylglutamate-semialdehyde dehydrogenase n=1 Tax=Sphingomonas crusticola TaxID=1697973 RepID=UPI000E227BBC|nr:succinylglutamate-semialdehyde dehydrogenase [Sphingomonas crusticola]